jgi:hypothetical protein
MQQRIALDKMRDSTWTRYVQTIKGFQAFLNEQKVFELRLMTKSPGCIANKQVVWNQSSLTVNHVSFGSMSRFCVTPASQF